MRNNPEPANAFGAKYLLPTRNIPIASSTYGLVHVCKIMKMASASVERDGIVVDDVTGETFIPASRRPDGSWRKARRVKEGYVPQEEMPVYENRGVQWLKSKPQLPPGLNPDEVDTSSKKTSDATAPMSKAAKKNAKRKEKKKQQSATEKSVNGVTQALAETKISPDQSDKTKLGSKSENVANSQSESTAGDKAEIVKKVRNLRKKLKQIEDLEKKIQSGELKNPEKEQLGKVAKKDTILSEIEDLELALEDL